MMKDATPPSREPMAKEPMESAMGEPGEKESVGVREIAREIKRVREGECRSERNREGVWESERERGEREIEE